MPSIQQLYQDILNDLQAEMQVNIPLFGKVFLRALALVQAAKLKLFYLAVAKVQKNIFVDTADSEAIGGTLERFGRVKLNRNPFPAREARYEVRFTGTVGSVIPAQTTFKSNDDTVNPGQLYVLESDFTITVLDNTAELRSILSGTDVKQDVGSELTSTVPLNGVENVVTITSEVLAPLASESLEDYRQKAIDAYRLEPQGGASTDYRLWSLDVAGIKQVYPYAKSGVVGEVNVFVEANIADSTDGKGTPSQAILDDVTDTIEFDPDTTLPLNDRGRRPLGAFIIHTLPITIIEVDVIITGYQGLTSTIQTELTTQITNAINEVRPFVAGADVPADKNDVLSVNRIIQVVLNTYSTSFFSNIELRCDGVSYSLYQFINGNIPHVNSISFA